MKKKSIISLSVLAVAGLLLLRSFGPQMGVIGMTIEHFCPGLISTASWVRCLEDDPTSHGYGVYGILEGRKTDAAIGHALKHIGSNDAYLWLNAATYLGSRNRSEAIPYLIKSIRHTASRSLDERTAMLAHLTPEAFGDDAEAWREWYLASDPTIVPEWEEDLGSSPKIRRQANN